MNPPVAVASPTPIVKPVRRMLGTCEDRCNAALQQCIKDNGGSTVGMLACKSKNGECMAKCD
jgi:hypothetical protein